MKFLYVVKGCIPVFLENDYVKPFSEVLDWNRASITVHLADLNRIHDILGFISSSKEEEMRGQVNLVMHLSTLCVCMYEGTCLLEFPSLSIFLSVMFSILCFDGTHVCSLL